MYEIMEKRTMSLSRTIKSFSLSKETVEVLKQLESFSFYNVSRFADTVLRERGLDVLCMLKLSQDIDFAELQKKLKDYEEPQQ